MSQHFLSPTIVTIIDPLIEMNLRGLFFGVVFLQADITKNECIGGNGSRILTQNETNFSNAELLNVECSVSIILKNYHFVNTEFSIKEQLDFVFSNKIKKT